MLFLQVRGTISVWALDIWLLRGEWQPTSENREATGNPENKMSLIIFTVFFSNQLAGNIQLAILNFPSTHTAHG